MGRNNRSTAPQRRAPQRSKRRRDLDAVMIPPVAPIRRTPVQKLITPSGKCCGKLAYADQATAERALAQAQQNRKRVGKEVVESRVYECRQGKWHLTHQSLEERKARYGLA